MKKWLFILALALCSLSASATQTRTQHVVKSACGTSCAVTITANGTGSSVLLVIGCLANSATAGRNCTAVSGGGTWTHPASCVASTTTAAGATDFWYLIAPASSVTTVTVTFGNANSSFNIAWFEEITTDTSGWTFGACGTPLSNQTATTTPVLPSITPNGTKNYMAGVMWTGGSTSAGSTVSGAGWTTPILDIATGDGLDDGLDYAGGVTQATFTSTSGAYCSSDLWFKDASSAGAASPCTLAMRGYGPC